MLQIDPSGINHGAVIRLPDQAGQLIALLQSMESPAQTLASTYQNWVMGQGGLMDNTLMQLPAEIGNAVTMAQQIQQTLADAQSAISQLQQQVAQLQGQIQGQQQAQAQGGPIQSTGGTAGAQGGSSMKSGVVGLILGVAVGIGADEGYRYWQEHHRR